MGAILVAMPRHEDSSRICDIIRQSDIWEDVFVCDTGSEVLRRIEDMDISLVVCTRRLSDMGLKLGMDLKNMSDEEFNAHVERLKKISEELKGSVSREYLKYGREHFRKLRLLF